VVVSKRNEDLRSHDARHHRREKEVWGKNWNCKLLFSAIVLHDEMDRCMQYSRYSISSDMILSKRGADWHLLRQPLPRRPEATIELNLTEYNDVCAVTSQPFSVYFSNAVIAHRIKGATLMSASEGD
jgi:hypothetical protein